MKKWMIITLVCAAVVPTGCRSRTKKMARDEAQTRWDQVRADIKLRQAKDQYEAGMLSEAVQSAMEAISHQSDLSGGYVLIAQAYAQTGNFQAAHAAIRTARQKALDTPALDFAEGIVLELQGHAEDAIVAYRRARKKTPGDTVYIVPEIELLVALGRTNEALDLLDALGDRVRKDDTLAALAAHIRALRHDEEGAMVMYAAAAKQSSHPVISEEFALRLASRGRCAEAVPVLRELVSTREPDQVSVSVVTQLAACLLEQARYAEAADLLKPTMQAHPHHARGQIILAKAAIARNDIMTALTALDHARRVQPDHPELLLVRATVQFRRGRYQEAAADLYTLLEQTPDDIDAMCLLAEVFAATGRTEAARIHFRQALELDDSSAWARQGLSFLDNDRSEPEMRLTGGKLETPVSNREAVAPLDRAYTPYDLAPIP